MIKSRGRLNLVISSPSGGGKSTAVKSLLKLVPQLVHSVSYTTRRPRAGEVHGREYFFITDEQFRQKITNNDFAEWAQVHDHYYGTDKHQLIEHHRNQNDVVLDLDVQGALQFQRAIPSSILVFLLPPSREALVQRLTRRDSEPEAERQLRLANATQEMQYITQYDYLVVNDQLDEAILDLCAIIRAERLKKLRVAPDELQRLLMEVETWT